MRKLRLDVDSLVVQSFETASALPMAGTVRGNGGTQTDAGSGCPIDTCTCGETTCCPETVPVPATPTVPVPTPPVGDSDCHATWGPCTCEPIETCSCAAPDWNAVAFR